MRIAILGCGGIGYYLAEGISRQTLTEKEPSEVFFVDGDVIQEKNLERQFFAEVVGWNKAEALRHLMSRRFGAPHVTYTAVPAFLNEKTIGKHKSTWLQAPLTVFVCVDNHASRAFLEEQASRLSDCVVVCGGNDFSTGQAQLYVRKAKRNITPKISEIAPEILSDKSPLPDGVHCLEEAQSEPQLALVNRAVAIAMEMLWHFDVDRTGKAKPQFNEIRVNLNEGRFGKFWRDPVVGKKKNPKGGR